MEKVDKVFEEAPLKMIVPGETNLMNKIVLRLVDVAGDVPGKHLWDKTTVDIKSGDKVGIIGSNGAGKTTLVNKMINEDDGVQLHPSIKIGYFKQDLSSLKRHASIIDNVMETSAQDETLARTILARLHFYRDDVHKTVNVLSGGERVKVILAKLLTSDINMLILDEPTNYLDIEAIEALEKLIQEYTGTVLFISHDRQFVENTATKIIEIDKQTLTFFNGTLKQYKEHSSKPVQQDTTQQNLMVIETKISEVLGKLSIEPSEELEQEFQTLLKEKKNLEDNK
jgi:pleuromutilin/lincosamide/streptogramin A transport system ATP-binding/permease protein